MPEIMLLDEETIDKIAAGEVVERPSSVVKELVENAIDAKASSITVEIKEGGISFIRITDNGCGIAKNQVPLAFMRHSTSKIKTALDLSDIHSLGFRGEALSSIAAVSQVELITKTYSDVSGTRYVIEGSKEISNEEIGAPDGTTFIIRNLFYNTPARRKFLKSPQTEGSYVADLMEHMALSHPGIAFQFMINGQTKLQTSGNAKEKDLIYHIFGRDITSSVLEASYEIGSSSVHGFMGKPIISRGNRNYEYFFINGRYVKSRLLSKAIEDGYKGFMMQHQYPFCVLYIDIDPTLIDVNVHPTKMEIRFSENEKIYGALCDAVRRSLTHRELIPDTPVTPKAKGSKQGKTVQNVAQTSDVESVGADAALIRAAGSVAKDSPYERRYPQNTHQQKPENIDIFDKLLSDKTKIQQNTARAVAESSSYNEVPTEQESELRSEPVYEQQTLFEQGDTGFLTNDARKKHRIIGQVFDTYWLVEYEDNLFLVDQHAAHEKVLYERTMKRLKDSTFTSQAISPPVIVTLDATQEEMLKKMHDTFASFGYAIEHFGGREYAVTSVPAEFESIDMKSMLINMLDDLAVSSGKDSPDLIMEKVASMSCKAAVKGNEHISEREAMALIDELLTLDNPYQCPHGRPTIIKMSKYEIEKKFKRTV
jgi:DNA mismatch repair protein MutL